MTSLILSPFVRPTSQVHFAEEWNEAHHLLIMESLGGDQAWVDRFIAQHAAVVYYVALNIMWFIRWVWM